MPNAALTPIFNALVNVTGQGTFKEIMSTCNYTICKILLSAENYQVPSAKITRKKVFK